MRLPQACIGIASNVRPTSGPKVLSASGLPKGAFEESLCQRYLLRVWDDGAVIFDRFTGDTHALNVDATFALLNEPVFEPSTNINGFLSRFKLSMPVARVESARGDLVRLGVLSDSVTA